jgi:omega-6 fatty acid desaturase (delta-12 desaturase)
MTTPSYQDFTLKPFSKRSNARALLQISNTLIPYGLLWWLMLQAAAVSLWLTPPFLILLSLFSLRSFSLMHDCGHGSLFTTARLNRIFGFLLGVVNAIPQLSWSIDHAYHHKTNGDWERYRGVADFLSLDEFQNLSHKEQKIYETTHHPLMAIPGGFYYLAIKPRLDLLVGLISPKNRMWGSREELNDLCLSNLFSLIAVICLGWWIGFGLFLSLYSVVLCLTASSLIYVFYVQHIFEHSYANPSQGWSPMRGALEGSSLLVLPPLLQWFTASIGFHNIHHLCERIPNYNLEACHQCNQHLLQDVPTLTLGTMLRCSKFLLWDPDKSSLAEIPPQSKYSTI